MQYFLQSDLHDILLLLPELSDRILDSLREIVILALVYHYLAQRQEVIGTQVVEKRLGRPLVESCQVIEVIGQEKEERMRDWKE